MVSTSVVQEVHGSLWTQVFVLRVESCKIVFLGDTSYSLVQTLLL